MPTLPFSLKVPGVDAFAGLTISSTTYKFHGLLRFEGSVVHLEWAGRAEVEEVTGIDVDTRTVPLPPEALEVDVRELRRVEYRGGWWRPRLELACHDLRALRVVPGEEAGELHLHVARRDRAAAQAMAAALNAAMRTPSLHHTLPPQGVRFRPGEEDTR